MKSPRWDTISRIVLKLIEKEKYGHALIAIALFMAAGVATVGFAYLAGAVGVSAMTKQISGRK